MRWSWQGLAVVEALPGMPAARHCSCISNRRHLVMLCNPQAARCLQDTPDQTSTMLAGLAEV